MDKNKIHYCPVGLMQRQFGIYVTGAGMEETKPGEPYPHAYHSSDYYFTWRKGRALTDWEYQNDWTFPAHPLTVYQSRMFFPSCETDLHSTIFLRRGNMLNSFLSTRHRNR